MDREDLVAIVEQAPSPCFVVHEGLLRKNLAIIDRIRREADVKILLALKGFAMWSLFPLLREVLDGACASGVWEARLAREDFGGEVHTYAPAFTEEEVRELLELTDHLVFNTPAQWRRFRPLVAQSKRPIACGLRLNPEHSTAAVPLYDPCAPGSRLGTTRAALEGADLEGLSGFHFHTLCEQNAEALAATLAAVEDRFGGFLRHPGLRWFNCGGGHHLTRPDYNLPLLLDTLRDFKRRYNLDLYLEPGEAVVLGAGVLIASVVDFVDNHGPIAILDISATCHLPDVLEMPYRPEIVDAGLPGVKPYTCALGGLSCLAGDRLGSYSFDRPLQIGDRLVFKDMAHYTMVKTTFFNGVRHPALARFSAHDRKLTVVRRFHYQDYRQRLS